MVSLVVILCLLTASVTTLRAEDAIKLRYGGKKGDRFHYHTVVEFEQTQSINGQEFKTKNWQEDYSTYTLKKIAEDGNLHIESKNERLKIEGDFGPAGRYAFDSRSDERDTTSQLGGSLTPLYERLSGATLLFEITPRGNVKKVTGYEELVADVLKDNPIAAQFSGGGSNKAAKTGFQDQFVIFKAEAVKPGDAWEEPYELELPKLGTFKGKRVYTFIGPDKVGKTATLEISVNIDLTGEVSIDQGEAKVTGTFKTDGSSGTAQFDPVTGRVVLLEAEQSLSGNLSVEAGGNTIPLSFDQTVTTKRKLLDKLPE